MEHYLPQCLLQYFVNYSSCLQAESDRCHPLLTLFASILSSSSCLFSIQSPSNAEVHLNLTKKVIQVKEWSEFSCFGRVVVPLSAAGALQAIGKIKQQTKKKGQILLSHEREQQAFIRIFIHIINVHRLYIWHTGRMHVFLQTVRFCTMILNNNNNKSVNRSIVSDNNHH